MTRAATVKIFMQAFDRRSMKAFELFFQSKCDGHYQMTQMQHNASIIIVDFDLINDKNRLLQIISTNQNQVILAASLVKHQSDNARIIFIHKPLNYLELKQYLSKAEKMFLNGQINQSVEKTAMVLNKSSSSEASSIEIQKMKLNSKNTKVILVRKDKQSVISLGNKNESHYVGQNEDIDLNNPQMLLKIFYSPDVLFQGALKQAVMRAKKHQCVVELSCLNTSLIMDLKKNLVYSSSGESVLRPLCILPVKQIDSLLKIKDKEVEKRLTNLKRKTKKELKQWRLDSFLWKISLWSSRGKIRKQVDLNKPVYLSEWPNFTRLQLFPHAMRIASLLIQQPLRLADIADKLYIPQRYVFSFFNAAEFLGIAGVSKRQVDQLIIPPSKKATETINQANQNNTEPSRSLLGGLLQHLVTGSRHKVRNRA